jgi:hypothetical protein
MYQQNDPYNITTFSDKDNKKEHNDNREDRMLFRRHKHDELHKHDDVISEIKEVPVTMEHKAPRGLDALGNAGLPRAFIAPSKEVPNGTPDGPKNKTVLQQHVSFWDTDNDGVISPLDTWKGTLY